MGEGKRRCRGGPWDEGTGGVHKGHFHIPAGMVARGGRRQAMCQPALHLTEKHSFLVKGTLTHLTLRIIRGGGGQGRISGTVRARERLRVDV